MKRYFPCILIGILFIIINFFSPLAGDDFVFALNSEKDIFLISSQLYLTWSGRFLSNILVIFLANKPIIWLVLCGILFAGISFYMLRISEVKSFASIILIILFVFGVSTQIRMETYSWMTGIIFYMLPLLASFIYIDICFSCFILKDKELHNYHIVMMLLSSLILGLMMENIAAAMILFNAIVIVYIYIYEKKIYFIHMVCALIVLVGFLSIYLSPGNALRSSEYLEFNSLSVLGKIIYNIPSVLKSTYLDNRLLVFVLSVLLISKLINVWNSWLFKAGVILFFSIAIFTSMGDTVKYLMDSNLVLYSNEIYSLFYRLTDSSSVTTIIYWGLYTVVLIISLIHFKKTRFFILCVFALSANAAMLLSPIVGGRTGVYTLFHLYVIALNLFEEQYVQQKESRKREIFFIVCAATLYNISIFAVIYTNVYRIKNQQLEAINDYCGPQKCPDEYDYQVILEPYPDNSIHTGNMLTTTHQNAFKQYYNLPFWVLLNYDMETW